MSSLENFNFLNHQDKCRCCFRPFEEEDDQIKVTKIVQNRFLQLTQLKLEVGDGYSSVICERCNNELKSFSSWRQELVFKQTSLHEFVEDSRIIKGRRDLSDQGGSENSQTLTERDDEDMAENVEIKIETEEFVFDGETTTNDQSSTSPFAQAKAQSHKIFRNQESRSLGGQSTSQMSHSAQGSNEGRAALFHDGIVELVKKTQRQEDELPKKPMKPAEKKIVCQVCGNSFKTNRYLKQHYEAVHLKIKKFKCDICGRKFYKKGHLRAHMSRHIEGKPRMSASNDRNCYDSTRPFPCKAESCGKFFKTKWDLQRHSTHHSDKRPYGCHCGKAYKRVNNLNRHQAMAHHTKQ